MHQNGNLKNTNYMEQQTLIPSVIQHFKEYFKSNYPYVEYTGTEKQLVDYLITHQDEKISKIANLFYDYILSQGLADVQE